MEILIYVYYRCKKLIVDNISGSTLITEVILQINEIFQTEYKMFTSSLKNLDTCLFIKSEISHFFQQKNKY